LPDPGERRLALGWGRLAEDAVAAKLVERGWNVLERNFHAQGGELDIIVERSGKLRFVEVRAREAGTDDAVESITPTKQRRMRVAAEVWMLARTAPFEEVAFLIAAVELDQGRVSKIEWIDDAF
jgi:putative endonuclease